MPKTKLDIAVEELRQYFQLFSLEDLVSGDIARNFSFLNFEQDNGLNLSGVEDDPLLTKLSDLFIQTQQGSLPTPEITRKVISFDQTKPIESQLTPLIISEPYFERNLLPFKPGISEILGDLNDSSDGINVNPSNPTKDQPTVGMFLIRNSRIALSNKNGNALSIFMNSIPTHEWNLAVPFINIKFQFQRPAVSSTGRANTPSINRFLEGATQLGQNTFDLKLQTGTSVDQEFILAGDGESIAEAGTELFLMPQTLVNPNSSGDGTRVVPVIDRFRPMASLISFDVSVVSAVGLMAHRTANLKFTLHDRSRLSELSDFIKSGLYNKTEMLIEYGWEHPDKSQNNVFANFINGLRTKEKYAISNNSFQFKNNGEVDVELSLYTKGAVDMYTSQVAAGSNEIISERDAIAELQERIGELRRKVFKPGAVYTKEIRGQQILNTASDTKAELELTKDLRKELKQTLKVLESNPTKSAKELRERLIELFGEKGRAQSLGSNIASVIDKKMKKISGRLPERGGRERTPDPFMIPLSERRFDKILGEVTGELRQGEKEEQFVSLAKLMLLFVLQPLASTKKFDDIQLLFYNMNNSAGFGRGQNIGQFPIDYRDFKKQYKKIATLKRTANLSLREFMQFVSNRFIEDIANPIYGLRDFYRAKPDKETGKAVPKERADRKDPRGLNTKIEQRLKEVTGGVFKLPQIDMYVECVPGHPAQEGQSKDSLEAMTILRIHVFDKLASSFESQSDFLASQREDEIRALGNLPPPKETDEYTQGDIGSLKKLISAAERKGLIEAIRNDNRNDGEDPGPIYRFKGGPNKVKEFIAQTMPTIIFGANNTAIIDAGLETLQDQKLSTINMINSGDKGDLEANGGATNGLPVRVFPAQMNSRMFGCPILEYTQGFFADFQTGTTIDNVYLVSNIEHNMGPGKFSTAARMTPVDGYGQYQSMVQKVNEAVSVLAEIAAEEENNGANPLPDNRP